MLRIIVEFLTKVGLSIEIKLVKLFQQEQGLILDELSHIQRVFCCFVIKGLRASVLNVKPVSFPLPRSLSRYAPAVRLRRADRAHRRVITTTLKRKGADGKKPRSCRFSIGSAPLTSITETDAQISGGETRQDYKDTYHF